MTDFPERDWKHLRALHPLALDRYCSRILGESNAIIADTAISPHERYLQLYRLIQRRDRTIANAFNDLRRSTATQHLASLITLEILTSEELTRFTPQTRDAAAALVESLRSSKGHGSILTPE